MLASIRRIQQMQAIALPISRVESTSVRFEQSTDDDARLGSVVAPARVFAEDVVVRNLPTCARPGYALAFDLVIVNEYTLKRPVDLQLQFVAESLLQHAHVNAFVDSTATHLNATYNPFCRTHECGVSVCIRVPAHATTQSRVVVAGITIAGQPMLRQEDVSFPMSFEILAGVHAPFKKHIAGLSRVVITNDGTLVALINAKNIFRMFAADGVELRPLVLPINKAQPDTSSRVAAVDESNDALIICKNNGLIWSVNMLSRHIRWKTVQDVDATIVAMTMLPRHGLVLTTGSNKICAYQVSDGTQVSSTQVFGCSQIASDAATSTVFATTITDDCFIVAYQWDPMANTLVLNGQINPPFQSLPFRRNRFVEVVPASASPASLPYLVVGTWGFSKIYVFSLPDRCLIHTHVFNYAVENITADPSGNALAVQDSAKTLYVIPWPLPGMDFSLSLSSLSRLRLIPASDAEVGPASASASA
jgi:hypothetical protein